MSPPRDTIFALSSGRIPAAIAVVRISGPRAGDALKALSGRIPEPRKAAFARVRDPQTAEPIDEALALWFPGPNSETGEDVTELQLHGGRAVLAAVFAALGRMDGVRPAEAGEFTRRGFENGKIDLTAVEGLADLVAAETEGQRRQALRQMQGALRARAEGWREKLISALALVEAGIDFSDEGDVPEDLSAPARAIARELEAEIAAALDDGRRGERLREGMVVAIAGPPNAGKSTLLNRLAQREVAIVSPYAGTTRDVIEVHLDLGGWPVTLLDTAGIRKTADPVEMEGVRRAQARAAAADLVLWVVTASSGTEVKEAAGGWRGGEGENSWARPLARSSESGQPTGQSADAIGRAAPAPGTAANHCQPPVWLVLNKTDLCGAASQGGSEGGAAEYDATHIRRAPPRLSEVIDSKHPRRHESNEYMYSNSFYVSSTTGSGFEGLVGALQGYAETLLGAAEPALITRERQRSVLQSVHAALARAKETPDEELFAEELRTAANALGRLTGRVDVEDILDVIFRDFCIGK
jgi:tRNA modification GTPase